MYVPSVQIDVPVRNCTEQLSATHNTAWETDSRVRRWNITENQTAKAWPRTCVVLSHDKTTREGEIAVKYKLRRTDCKPEMSTIVTRGAISSAQKAKKYRWGCSDILCHFLSAGQYRVTYSCYQDPEVRRGRLYAALTASTCRVCSGWRWVLPSTTIKCRCRQDKDYLTQEDREVSQ